ncbi:MAG TPA: cache domain-containing protein, partial [Spirochaetia bacterium]|nr:cache domain-containing protein [Spirochaetia bacterium]
MRLANRIFISIFGILILSIVSSTIIGAVLISNATNSEAISRVNMGLKEARAYLDGELDSLIITAQILAEDLEGKLELPVTPDIAEKFPTGLPAALAQAGIRGRQRQAGILSLSAEAVASLNIEPDELKPLPRCPGGNLMCLFAVDQGRTGPAFAAIILNGNFGFVTTLQENLFGRALYGNKPFGTVTVFCKDTRVATTVIGPEGRVAIGTKVSDVVKEKTLIKGERWLDRAFVVDEWYISAYEPLRNPLGENIGILYVGVLEKKYVDIRREAIFILSLVTLPALGLLLIGAFILARGIVRPLSNLALAAGKITRGQWDIEIPPETGDR